MTFSRFHRKDVLDLQWSTDGTFLISGSVDNTCIIWDVNKGRAANVSCYIICASVDSSCAYS